MFQDIYEKYIVKYYKIIIACGVVLTLTILLIFIGYHQHKQLESLPKQTKPIVVKETKPKVEVKNFLYVDVKGAVTKPDVYKLEEGARIIDAINVAGGLKEEADTSVLNLSKKITDEMVIIIYTKEQINNFTKENKNSEEVIKYIEKDCNCPDPNLNGACIKNDEPSSNSDDEISDTLVSINSASIDQLMTLPGIGESKAQSIITYRNTNGSFKVIDDIKNVTGIGDSIFDKIKDFITI